MQIAAIDASLALSMTTANKVTLLRILLVPFFVVELVYYVRSGNEVYRLAALLSFAVAAILDGVDGYIARRYHQMSELGKVLDPLADKLLLVSGVVTLSFDHGSFLGQMPLWLTGMILGRDLLILIGMGVILFIAGRVTVRPRFPGKIATVLQMVSVLWILLKWDEGSGQHGFLGCALGAAAFTALSGLLYGVDAIRQLGAHPHSSPTPRGP